MSKKRKKKSAIDRVMSHLDGNLAVEIWKALGRPSDLGIVAASEQPAFQLMTQIHLADLRQRGILRA